MDITLIATAVMTFIGPYITKAAESVAEGVGADLWGKIKTVFTKDKEKEFTQKFENGLITNADLGPIESALIEHLNEKRDFLQTINESLNIKSTNKFILESNLKVAARIREELQPLYMEQVDAGIAVEGDYRNRIAQLERKLNIIDEKIVVLISKK